MATTDRAAELHEPLCRDLMKKFVLNTPELDNLGRIEYLIKTGVIDAGRLFEIVTSLETGIPLKSIEGMDLEDSSNCKLSGSFGPVNGQKTAFGWRIKVTNCVGDVRVLLHHPETGETFSGVIPYDLIKDQNWLTITWCKGKNRFGKFTKYIEKVGHNDEAKGEGTKENQAFYKELGEKFWNSLFAGFGSK
jgi:hypothetical protein